MNKYIAGYIYINDMPREPLYVMITVPDLRLFVMKKY